MADESEKILQSEAGMYHRGSETLAIIDEAVSPRSLKSIGETIGMKVRHSKDPDTWTLGIKSIPRDTKNPMLLRIVRAENYQPRLVIELVWAVTRPSDREIAEVRQKVNHALSQLKHEVSYPQGETKPTPSDPLSAPQETFSKPDVDQKSQSERSNNYANKIDDLDLEWLVLSQTFSSAVRGNGGNRSTAKFKAEDPATNCKIEIKRAKNEWRIKVTSRGDFGKISVSVRFASGVTTTVTGHLSKDHWVGLSMPGNTHDRPDNVLIRFIDR